MVLGDRIVTGGSSTSGVKKKTKSDGFTSG